MSLKEIVHNAFINSTDIELGSYDLLEQLTPDLVIIIANMKVKILGTNGDRVELVETYNPYRTIDKVNDQNPADALRQAMDNISNKFRFTPLGRPVRYKEYTLTLHPSVENIAEILSIMFSITLGYTAILAKYEAYNGERIDEFIRAAHELGLGYTDETDKVIKRLISYRVETDTVTDSIKKYFSIPTKSARKV